MNRKGDFLDFFGDFVTIFVIATILSALFFITSFDIGKKDTSKILQIQNDIHPMILLNLMKTPYSLDITNDGDYITTNIADLIVYSYKNDNFSKSKDAIKSQLRLLFINNQCIWSLNVYDQDKMIFSVGKFDINPYGLDNPNIRLSNITIPVNTTKSLTIFYGDNLLDHEYGKC